MAPAEEISHEHCYDHNEKGQKGMGLESHNSLLHKGRDPVEERSDPQGNEIEATGHPFGQKQPQHRPRGDVYTDQKELLREVNRIAQRAISQETRQVRCLH